MRLFPFLLPALSILALPGGLFGISDLPALKATAPTVTVQQDGAIAAIDLRDYFEVTGITNPVVQLQFNVGTVNLEMFPSKTPQTVANFLNYVRSGRYANSILHRSVSNFIVQGGGYTLPDLAKITADAPVINEFGISNTRGTVAMAKLGGDPNSATSEWFFNLGDNSANLDNQNGGFTVFARVAGTGMSVVDAVAALPVFDKTTDFGTAFSQFPLQNYDGTSTVQLANVVTLVKAGEVPLFPGTVNEDAVIHYGGSISNPGLVTGSLRGSMLQLAVVAGQSGETDVTIEALDSQDNKAAMTVHVIVNATSGMVDPPVVVVPPIVAPTPWDAIGLNKEWFGAFDGTQWPVIVHPLLQRVTVDARSNSTSGYYFAVSKSRVRYLFTNRQYYPWFYAYATKGKGLRNGWVKVRVRHGKRQFLPNKKKEWITDL